MDITERASAEPRLADIIEALGEGLILVGADGATGSRPRGRGAARRHPRPDHRRAIRRVLRRDAAPRTQAVPGRRPPFARLARGDRSVRDFEMRIVTPQQHAPSRRTLSMPQQPRRSHADHGRRRSAQARRAAARNIFEAMIEGVVIIGPDGRYKLTNHAAEGCSGSPGSAPSARASTTPRRDASQRTAPSSPRGPPVRAPAPRGAGGARATSSRSYRGGAPPRPMSINAVPLRDAPATSTASSRPGSTSPGEAAERGCATSIETHRRGPRDHRRGRALRALEPRQGGPARRASRAHRRRPVRRRAVGADRRRRRSVRDRGSSVRAAAPGRAVRCATTSSRS